MAAKVKIQDGPALREWASPSIVPSKDIVVSPGSSPNVSSIRVGSKDVYVYVKVENIGDIDLSSPDSTIVGPWSAHTAFAGYMGNTSADGSALGPGSTFRYSSTSGDTLDIPGVPSCTLSTSIPAKRAWGWSPDGRYFAYVSSVSGTDWHLQVIALQDINKSDGTPIGKGEVAGKADNVFDDPWTDHKKFSWAGSRAVSVVAVNHNQDGISRWLLCPESPNPLWSPGLLPNYPGQIDWLSVVGPCGWAVAYVPKKLNGNQQEIMLVTTADAKSASFKKNNVSTSVTTKGPNPLIRTAKHSALGIEIDLGDGTKVWVDDPEEAFLQGGVEVRVDRVKASTLPSANLGVIAVGTGVVSMLPALANRWVKVPNQHGWDNESEPHWCLLAQAYTVDKTTIKPAWDGHGAFPNVPDDNCAQRNVEILP